MSARILFVHNDLNFAEGIIDALRQAPEGYEIALFTSSMSALDELERTERVDILITRVQFPPSQPNGISLALMLRMKRPDVKVLFLTQIDVNKFAQGVGELMRLPVTADDVVAKVREMLSSSP